MASIFTEKDSVFFVGGRGTKAGDANAGGCTKAAWEDAGLCNKTLSRVMDTNGESFVNAICAVTDNGAGKCRLTKAGDVNIPCVGLVAFVSFDALHASGRYEVIAWNPVDWVDIDLAFVGVEDCYLRVGGAFDTLQNAIDKTDASHGYNVQIYDNKPETLGATLDFDTTGGSIANNSQFIVEGFNVQPGDMNYKKTYYQSPMDCLKNGVDTNKCVTLNANGGAFPVISIDNFDGLVLKNFYPYNTNKASPNNGVTFANTPVDVSFVNCRVDTAYYGVSGQCYGGQFRDCYFGNDMDGNLNTDVDTYGGAFVNCVFNSDGLTYGPIIKYTVFESCLFWKGLYGCKAGYPVHLVNCVFYGQTTACIQVYSATYACITGYNNIFIPAEAADFAVRALTAAGSVSDDALVNSCVWTLAGVAMINHISVNGLTRQLSSVIDADPLFKDAVNNDFKLKINSPCLKTGIQTLGKL